MSHSWSEVAANDLAVFLPSSNVLIMGDLFTNGSYPVIDESSGGSLRRLIEALERVVSIASANTIVIPGHGLVAECNAIAEFLRMMESRILALIKTRRSASEVIAATPTAECASAWGTGCVTGADFTRMVLAGLQHGEPSTARATN